MDNRLLSCLDASDLGLLEPHLRRVPLVHGDVLHEPATAVDWVYFPLSGAVSLVVVMKGGETIEIGSVGREGAIGCLRVWAPRMRAPGRLCRRPESPTRSHRQCC